MTPAEVIRTLKRLAPNPYDFLARKAVEEAIKALEKQVPKKPHKIHDMNVNGHPYYESVCHDCEYVLDACKDDFCPNCGQAIDWSDYND